MLKGDLPEIQADQLSADALRSRMSVARAVIVRKLLGPAEVETLSAGVERAFAAWDNPAADADWFTDKGLPPSISISGHWRRNQGAILSVECPPMLERLRQVFRQVGLVDFVANYFDETPVLSTAKTSLRLNRPGQAGIGWHQDGAFLGEGARVLNTWIALTPCGVNAPSLDIAMSRKDKVVGAGEDDAEYPWSVGELRAMRETEAIATPVMAPGDAILFDHLCLHRTSKTGAAETRKAIEAWFFAPESLPPDYDAITL